MEDLRASKQRCYRIRWNGDGAGLLQALHASDAMPSMTNRPDEARVIVPDDWQTRTFFELAKRNAVVLTGLAPEEEDLEAIYHRLIKKSQSTAEQKSANDAEGIAT